MGQQQLLLIVLGVIVVGIAVAAGIGLFSASKDSSIKDELVNQTLAIAANAQQYFSKPTSMGGGNNSFANFGTGGSALGKLGWTTNGTYSVGNGSAASIVITGTPKDNVAHNWTVTTTVLPDSMYTSIQ